MIPALVVPMAAEHAEKVNHWLIGGITLLILFGLIAAVVAFGNGREHS